MYESFCDICNTKEQVKTKEDKLEKFKKEVGVYVGESGRSIYERAGEHRQDALDRKEDSHMVKHWQISHPELEEPPSFSMKVVGTFQDDMSRQLSEAIRIELRGDNVLN